MLEPSDGGVWAAQPSRPGPLRLSWEASQGWTWEVWGGNSIDSSSTLPPRAAKPMATWLSEKISHLPWNPTSAVLWTQPHHHPTPPPRMCVIGRQGVFAPCPGFGRVRERSAGDGSMGLSTCSAGDGAGRGREQRGRGCCGARHATFQRRMKPQNPGGMLAGRPLVWAPWKVVLSWSVAREERLVKTR